MGRDPEGAGSGADTLTALGRGHASKQALRSQEPFRAATFAVFIDLVFA